MDVFVDLQGFRGVNGEFIPKEIAVISADGYKVETLLIEPPENYSELPPSVKKEVSYLEKHFHGLPWGSGYVNFEEFELEVKRILQCFDTVYVKGNEKLNVLNFLNKNIVNLEQFGCPTLRQLRKKTKAVQCTQHTIDNPVCALENVLILSEWWRLTNEHSGVTEGSADDPESIECTQTCLCV